MDPLILVLGATDSGKSSLVRWLSGEGNTTENLHNPEPMEIEVVSYYDGAIRKTVTVLEAPGFDHPDEDMTDDKILGLIGMYFHNKLEKRTDVTGVINVHRLGDKSVLGGTAKKILQLVYDFCGSEACKNVVFATTSWEGHVEEQTSAIRKQLTSQGVLKQMLDSGAHFVQYDGRETSARQVLSSLLVKNPTRLAFLEDYMKSPFSEKPWLAAQTFMKTGLLRHPSGIVAEHEEKRAMENNILSLLQTNPIPPSPFKVTLSNFQVIGLASSGRSIMIAVDAAIVNRGTRDVSEYDGEVTVGYNTTRVGRARLTISNMEKRKSIDLPQFEVEFEPPDNANTDVQNLLQALILTKESLKIKLVFPNPFHGDDSSEPALSIVESEICGNAYKLIELVHVYVGIKVLTSKTLSFQFHFTNPFPVDLAICNFEIIAGKDGKKIARATSDKVFRLRPMTDRVSERANDARLCAGYIDAGRFLVGGSSSKLSIDLNIERAKILVGDFAMDGLKFNFLDVPLTYGKPDVKFKKQTEPGSKEKKA